MAEAVCFAVAVAVSLSLSLSMSLFLSLFLSVTVAVNVTVAVGFIGFGTTIHTCQEIQWSGLPYARFFSSFLIFVNSNYTISLVPTNRTRRQSEALASRRRGCR